MILPIIGDNLAARIGAILLGGFVFVALIVTLLIMWPRPGDTASGLFSLPLPHETLTIVEAVEASPPQSRHLVVRALNTSIITVHLATEFPPVAEGLQRSPRMEVLFRGYADNLGDRVFRVDLRRGLVPAFMSLEGRSSPAPVQMAIQMRDGQVLIIERRPPELVRSYIGRSAFAAAAVGLVLLSALALAVRQTVRPVNRLAEVARAFSLDSTTADLPLSGPRELRELSAAFNEMQNRIRHLVDDRTRLLAAVAHDLRTYLTRLRLRMDFVSDPEQRLRGERDVDEMARLLDDILLFAQRDVQKPRPMAATEALPLIPELMALVAIRREVGDDVSLAHAETVPEPHIACPQLVLRRMLANLVDNALAYGDRARLSVEIDEALVTVVVDDDGPGIPEAELSRLLLPFERMEESRARATGGAGLGLSIVRALADGCDAVLALVNRPEGGLSASLTFPVVLPPPVGPGPWSMLDQSRAFTAATMASVVIPNSR